MSKQILDAAVLDLWNIPLWRKKLGLTSDSTGDVFIQETAPVTSNPTYLWIQTNVGGNPNNFTFWFEDGT